jgi:hypothetical protein
MYIHMYVHTSFLFILTQPRMFRPIRFTHFTLSLVQIKSYPLQGCQIVSFRTKNPNFMAFWNILWIFITIWCFLCSFGTFFRFWYHVPRKIWPLLKYSFWDRTSFVERKNSHPAIFTNKFIASLSLLSKFFYVCMSTLQFTSHPRTRTWALATWHSGHRVRLQNRRSRVRIPPGS